MTVIHGDCLDSMAAMPAESVDSIVSDPPYGLAFMGKAWDHGVPGEPFWREALRVAKPGPGVPQSFRAAGRCAEIR
jgi:site-specific DNA-methyltransferase (adenine-specific)